jgi:hypothetical protein
VASSPYSYTHQFVYKHISNGRLAPLAAALAGKNGDSAASTVKESELRE